MLEEQAMRTIYAPGAVIASRYEVLQSPPRDPSTGHLVPRDVHTGKFLDPVSKQLISVFRRGENPGLLGGSSIVYHCLDLELGCPVAVKTLQPQFTHGSDSRGDFLREVEVWIGLGSHPHLVRAHRVHYLEDRQEIMLVLDWISPGIDRFGRQLPDASLRTRWEQDGPLPALDPAVALHQIAGALCYAGSPGTALSHGDLKPENILIGRDGNAYLTDFGLAAAHRPAVIHTPVHPSARRRKGGPGRYQAPELRDGTCPNPRSDIFSFGVLLDEWLTKDLIPTCSPQVRNVDKLHDLARWCSRPVADDRPSSWTDVLSSLEAAGNIRASGSQQAGGGSAGVGDRERVARAWSWNAVGAAYLDLREYEKAAGFFRRVLDQGRELAYWEVEAAGLGNLALALEGSGQYREVEEPARRALTIHETSGNLIGQAACLSLLGLVHHSQGQSSRAIEFHTRHAAIARELGDRRSEATALGNLGNAQQSLGFYSIARDAYQQQRQIAQASGDRIGEAHALGGLGSTSFRLGNYAEAMDEFDQSLAISRGIGDREGEACDLGSLANVHQTRGNYRRACELYERCLQLARMLELQELEARTVGNLGLVYRSLEQPEKALQCHEQHLDLTRKLSIPWDEASALGNLGLAYLDLSRWSDARRFLLAQLRLARQLQDRQGIANAYGNLGLACSGARRWKRAAVLHLHHRMLARELDDRLGESRAQNNLANAFERLGDRNRALDLHRESWETARALGDRRGTAVSAYNLARALGACGLPREGIEYAQSACDHFSHLQCQEHTQQARHVLVLLQAEAAVAESQGPAPGSITAIFERLEAANSADDLLNLSRQFPVLTDGKLLSLLKEISQRFPDPERALFADRLAGLENPPVKTE